MKKSKPIMAILLCLMLLVGSFSVFGNEVHAADNVGVPKITEFDWDGSEMTIKWSPVKGATDYTVQLNYSYKSEYGFRNKWNHKNTSNCYGIFDFDEILKDESLTKEEYIKGLKIKVHVYGENSDNVQEYTFEDLYAFVKPAPIPYIRSGVETSANQVQLIWNSVKRARGYHLEKYDEKSKTWTRIANVAKGRTLEYIDKGLSANKEYTYRIRSKKVFNSKTYLSSWRTIKVTTLPTASSIKATNTKVNSGLVANVKESIVEVKSDGLRHTSGLKSWVSATTSNISSFLDYKGYYNYVYPNGNYIYINRVDTNTLKVVKTLKIKKRTGYDKVCGVTADKSGNYYVFYGKVDTEQTGKVNTVVISKYDYSGNLKGSCEFTGDETWAMHPYYLGNCVMTFDGKILVCEFGRQMYQSYDGRNHQASCVVAVNTKTMKKVSGYDNYVSHSFDQRILKGSDGSIVYVDLGDGYPERGICVSRNGGVTHVPFHFYGDTGQNETNAEIGEIIELSSGYVISGVSGKSMSNLTDNRQLFIMILDKETLKSVIPGKTRTGTSEGKKVTDTNVIWLTNYSNYVVANPKVVSIDKDRFAIFWQKFMPDREDESGFTADDANKLMGTYYMILSANGKILQKATSLDQANLNGNEEMYYKDGHVYWTSGYHDPFVDTEKNIPSTLYTNKLKIGAFSVGLSRIYGNDRYLTSTTIGKVYQEKTNQKKFNGVIIACGTNFPDALAASYLAAKKNIPILLWNNNNTNLVGKFIQKNVKLDGTIYMLGGEAVVSDYMRGWLERFASRNFKFKRLFGSTRYDTNIKILKNAGYSGEELLIANGHGDHFQTPLIASGTGKPLMIVNPRGLNAEQIKYLKDKKPKKITIIGNVDFVPKAIETELKKICKNTTRIGGKNADEISANVAKKYFPNAKEVFLATDSKYPDGLSGAPLAIKSKAPILLVNNKDYKNVKAYCKSINLIRATAFGGNSAGIVTDEILQSIANSKNRIVTYVNLTSIYSA